MTGILVFTSNDKFKSLEGQCSEIIIKRKAYFLNLITSEIDTITFGDTMVIKTKNSTYIFDLL